MSVYLADDTLSVLHRSGKQLRKEPYIYVCWQFNTVSDKKDIYHVKKKEVGFCLGDIQYRRFFFLFFFGVVFCHIHILYKFVPNAPVSVHNENNTFSQKALKKMRTPCDQRLKQKQIAIKHTSRVCEKN